MTTPSPEVIEKIMAIAPDYYEQSRTEMLPFIPASVNKLLDIGCNRGAFGFMIKSICGAEVTGIELDPGSASVAQLQLDRVIVGDINVVMKEIPDLYFDCITCNDVLEHLLDPYSVLAALKSKLAPGGIIVCSLPNVRYWDNIKDLLLRKQWKYMDHGILDRTHLRFFTELSMRDMFESLEFDILRMEGISPTRSDDYKFFNFVTGGSLKDARYLQFASVIRPRISA